MRLFSCIEWPGSSCIITDLFTEGVICDVVNEPDRVVAFSLAFANRDNLAVSS